MVEAPDAGRKAPRAGADDGAQKGPPGGWAWNRKDPDLSEGKMYRLGLSVGMLAVLVEALGAGLKWG